MDSSLSSFVLSVYLPPNNGENVKITLELTASSKVKEYYYKEKYK